MTFASSSDPVPGTYFNDVPDDYLQPGVKAFLEELIGAQKLCDEHKFDDALHHAYQALDRAPKELVDWNKEGWDNAKASLKKAIKLYYSSRTMDYTKDSGRYSMVSKNALRACHVSFAVANALRTIETNILRPFLEDLQHCLREDNDDEEYVSETEAEEEHVQVPKSRLKTEKPEWKVVETIDLTKDGEPPSKKIKKFDVLAPVWPKKDDDRTVPATPTKKRKHTVDNNSK
jgi:hypothetical protein